MLNFIGLSDFAVKIVVSGAINRTGESDLRGVDCPPADNGMFFVVYHNLAETLTVNVADESAML